MEKSRNTNLVKSLTLVIWFLSLLTGIATLVGILRFGYGLGDIFYGVITILFSVAGILVNAKKESSFILAMLALFFFLVLLLLISLLRGPESPWNGHFFF